MSIENRFIPINVCMETVPGEEEDALNNLTRTQPALPDAPVQRPVIEPVQPTEEEHILDKSTQTSEPQQ